MQAELDGFLGLLDFLAGHGAGGIEHKRHVLLDYFVLFHVNAWREHKEEKPILVCSRSVG